MITLPAAVTGAPQTGFTSPVYNTSIDGAVDTNQKQVAVTSLGGTQVGVDAHSVSRPFVINAARPKQFASLGKPNPTTGLIADVPMNKYRVKTTKGVTPLAGQPSRNAVIASEISIPAGSDVADTANLRAMLSAHIGTLQAISAGLGDTLVNGVL